MEPADELRLTKIEKTVAIMGRSFGPDGNIVSRSAYLDFTDFGVVSLPGARVRSASTQPVSSGGIDTTLTFDTVIFDSHRYWSSAVPSRLTVPIGQGGTYLVGAYATQILSGLSTGAELSLRITLNGSTASWVGQSLPHVINTGGLLFNVEGPVLLADGEYAEVVARNTGSTAISIDATALRPAFWVIRVR